MLNRILPLWQRLTGSLWFIPSLIVVAAAILAVALIEGQAYVDREALKNFPRIFGASADSSRSMLSAIAGSMITIAGVTFSITVVAVSQASNQYTPRILRNFMRDRPSQVVLGVFVGTFVYCLIVVRTIRGDDELRFIPSIAVLGAFVLAVIGIGFLVYFIHHIASTLEAGSILARVGQETVDAVDRLFPSELGNEAEEVPPDVPNTWQSVRATSTGYIQSVDSSGMLRLACDDDLTVRMDRGVGEFVVAHTPLASVSGATSRGKLEERINDLFTISTFRTVYQDAEFGVRQLVDIALKALSPGVNDTTTAIMSVDRIGAVFVRAANRRIEHPHRMNDGRLRVIARGPTFASLLKTGLDEIRQNATENVAVLGRMLSVIEEVLTCTSDAGRRAHLRRHAELIHRTAVSNVEVQEDLHDVHERYARILAGPALQSSCSDEPS